MSDGQEEGPMGKNDREQLLHSPPDTQSPESLIALGAIHRLLGFLSDLALGKGE